ncbi:MAG TPA: ELWxxDGT repeat protein [Thermoanaerobaculia bacterium]|nr:ELWxxDGT repeat protein [Thermoanaerobaculia bacterium]
MSRFLATLCALFATCALFAQSPYLFKDINQTVGAQVRNSNPSSFYAEGDTVYFGAALGSSSTVLWKYENGTATRLANATWTPNSPSSLVPMGDGTYLFTATNSTSFYASVELWKTDGTPAGTSRVKDIYSGNAKVRLGLRVGGLMYFYATTPATSEEVWVTDGTTAGTHMVKDLNGSSAPHRPEIVGPLGDKVVLIGDGGVWLTDGTEAGTTLVKGGIGAWNGTIIGSKVYFFGKDPAFGEELWVSDGTTAGTHQVGEINPTTGASFGYNLRIEPVTNGMVFYANDGLGHAGVWFSDGTSGGTTFVSSALPWNTYYTSINGVVYFNSGTEFWRTDGTIAGTYALDAKASQFFAAFSQVFYTVTQQDGSILLRRTDGTIGGTTTAMTFPAGTNFQSPAFTGGKLYYSYTSAVYGAEPWVSADGMTGSMLVNMYADQAPSSFPKSFIGTENGVFFTASEQYPSELWRTYGTPALTEPMTSLGTDPSFSQFTKFGSLLFFTANNELWKSDGTASGTVKANVFAGPTQPSNVGMFAGQNRLYLSTPSGLFVSDGTTAQQLTPDTAAASSLSAAGAFMEYGGRVLFYSPSGGYNEVYLWETAGTNATTRVIGTFQYGARKLAGGMFFSVETQGYPSTSVLSRIDLASMTPVPLVTLPAIELSTMTAAGRYVYFLESTSQSATALWRTDGTAAGTIKLRNVTGAPSGFKMTPVAESLYFVLYDPTYGAELWRSDGTPEGTLLVKDIAAGTASSFPSSLLAVDGELWFAADDGVHGVELWRSDGTEGGTSMLAEIAPSTVSSSPSELTKIGRRVYFSANDDVTGFEPWAVDLTGNALSIVDATISEGDDGTKTVYVTINREGDLSQVASVSFATEGRSATSGSDFVATSGVLSFSESVSSATIAVTINGDTTTEGDEIFDLVLSSPNGVALARARSTITIADDDTRVDLAVDFEFATPSYNSAPRQIRVTNNGPSNATGIKLRLTESPDAVATRIIDVQPIASGASRVVSYSRVASSSIFSTNSNAFILDLLHDTGYTATATATSIEIELTPANNTQSRMLNLPGTLMLPPFMQTQTTAYGKISTQTTSASIQGDSLVAITPGSNPANAGYSTLTLQAGSTAGLAQITGSAYTSFTISYPIVAAGQTPKLVAALRIEDSPAAYGMPLVFKATILGTRHDGVLPTGNVTFTANGGAVLGQGTLDANGSITFTRNNLSVGTWPHWMEYAGDANFLPMRTSFNLTVTHAATSLTGVLQRTSCYIAEGRVTLTAASGAIVPEGSIRVESITGGLNASFPLVPTGQPRQASAMIRVNIPTNATTLRLTFIPQSNSSQYESSYMLVPVSSFSACSGTSLYVMTPCRIIDTRDSTTLPGRGSRVVQAGGRCGIPADARAISANVTAVNPPSGGFLRMLPSGVLPAPVDTSTMSYRLGKTRAANTIILLNADGALDAYNGGYQPVHFIIDVYAYFK